jgi:Putative zinc-finger
MVVNCEEVWREVSNYLDGEVEPGLRAAMEEHVRGCRQCAAVLDGTRNVIQLYGDERMLEVPLGFSRRLEKRLEENISGSRRSFFGWMVAVAAAVLVAGAFVWVKSARPALRASSTGRWHTPGHDGGGGGRWEDLSCGWVHVYPRQGKAANHLGPGGHAGRLCPLRALYEKVPKRSCCPNFDRRGGRVGKFRRFGPEIATGFGISDCLLTGSLRVSPQHAKSGYTGPRPCRALAT